MLDVGKVDEGGGEGGEEKTHAHPSGTSGPPAKTFDSEADASLAGVTDAYFVTFLREEKRNVRRGRRVV